MCQYASSGLIVRAVHCLPMQRLADNLRAIGMKITRPTSTTDDSSD